MIEGLSGIEDVAGRDAEDGGEEVDDSDAVDAVIP